MTMSNFKKNLKTIRNNAESLSLRLGGVDADLAHEIRDCAGRMAAEIMKWESCSLNHDHLAFPDECVIHD
jgi:hypothetical protein